MQTLTKTIILLFFLGGISFGQVYLEGMKYILKGEGKAGDELGFGAIGLGDINGDKYPDFAVGANGLGKLLFYFGGPGILDNKADLILKGGRDVFKGDVNGDGLMDIISQKEGVVSSKDTFYIYLGNNSAKLSIDTIPGIIYEGKDAGFGECKAVGDLNGDGMTDLVAAGDSYYNPLPKRYGLILYIWFGKKVLTKEPDIYIIKEHSGHVSNFKISIADVNADSIGDLIIGYNYQNYEGSVPIVYSNIDIYYGKNNFSFDPQKPDQRLDSRILGMNSYNLGLSTFLDVNNDGIADMISSKTKNFLYVFYGSRDTFKLKEDRILINYDTNNVALYSEVFKVGDLNHDGYKDYVVRCAQKALPGILIYLGGPRGISTSPTAVSYQACDRGLWGKWVSDLGDINGDGYDELITTSPLDCISMTKQFGEFSIMTGWNHWKVDIKNMKKSDNKDFGLKQNYPNPFNAGTVISYSVEAQGLAPVQVGIYNILGKEIRKLIDENKEAGEYKVFWDGKDNQGISMPSGTYFYNLFENNKVKTNKMILLR